MRLDWLEHRTAFVPDVRCVEGAYGAMPRQLGDVAAVSDSGVRLSADGLHAHDVHRGSAVQVDVWGSVRDAVHRFGFGPVKPGSQLTC